MRDNKGYEIICTVACLQLKGKKDYHTLTLHVS